MFNITGVAVLEVVYVGVIFIVPSTKLTRHISDICCCGVVVSFVFTPCARTLGFKLEIHVLFTPA